MTGGASPEGRSPWTLFLLIVVLSVPFWVLGAVAELPASVPVNLPASAFMFVCPGIAASILTLRERGAGGVRRLWARAVDVRGVREKRWYIPALLLFPAIMAAEYGLMTALGVPLPDAGVPVLLVPVSLLVFFLPAVCEEVGWQGYACDPLRARWGGLGASLIMGAVWGAWHAVPYLQTGNPASWAVWQAVMSVGLRVLIVWVYAGAGRSVFLAVLFHDTANASQFLYPDLGSAYDPFLTAVITAVVVGAIVLARGPGAWDRGGLPEEP